MHMNWPLLAIIKKIYWWFGDVEQTWRKFLCLHWKAPLGAEPGPHSNISPAHRGQSQKKVKFYHLEKITDIVRNMQQECCCGWNDRGEGVNLTFPLLLWVPHRQEPWSIRFRYSLHQFWRTIQYFVFGFCLHCIFNVTDIWTKYHNYENFLFVCSALVLFCVTICATRCQNCTGLALSTPCICQIITNKCAVGCTKYQIIRRKSLKHLGRNFGR